ncbi:MAG: hypothetical protein H6810_00765 [Phycisphaeraceae bacterium]|nr:MAG: hypothetical protein H6810_00765 [Phycisphaeraceae bacterium]
MSDERISQRIHRLQQGATVWKSFVAASEQLVDEEVMLRVAINEPDRTVAVEMGRGGCQIFWPVAPDAVALIKLDESSTIQDIKVLREEAYYDWLDLTRTPPMPRGFTVVHDRGRHIDGQSQAD